MAARQFHTCSCLCIRTTELNENEDEAYNASITYFLYFLPQQSNVSFFPILCTPAVLQKPKVLLGVSIRSISHNQKAMVEPRCYGRTLISRKHTCVRLRCVLCLSGPRMATYGHSSHTPRIELKRPLCIDGCNNWLLQNGNLHSCLILRHINMTSDRNHTRMCK